MLLLVKGKEMTRIIVNGREHKFRPYGHRHAGYDFLLSLAGFSPEHLYTVTYSHGHNGAKGMLAPDESVKIADNMIFEITITGRA